MTPILILSVSVRVFSPHLISNVGPAEIPSKRRYIFVDCLRKARVLGAPLVAPPTHPFNPLAALRVASIDGISPAQRTALVTEIFSRYADARRAAVEWQSDLGSGRRVSWWDQRKSFLETQIHVMGLSGAKRPSTLCVSEYDPTLSEPQDLGRQVRRRRRDGGYCPGCCRGGWNRSRHGGCRHGGGQGDKATTADMTGGRGVFGVPTLMIPGIKNYFWGYDSLPFVEGLLFGDDRKAGEGSIVAAWAAAGDESLAAHGRAALIGRSDAAAWEVIRASAVRTVRSPDKAGK